MANKKYYTSETIEFQNGDKTVAKPLTLKKLKAFSEVFNDYTDSIKSAGRFMDGIRKEALEAGETKPDLEALYEAKKAAGEVPAELEDGTSYIDTLAACSLIALSKWGVTNEKEKPVVVDIDYIEDELDMDTLIRICEVAGSMQLGDVSDDVEGKVEG